MLVHLQQFLWSSWHTEFTLSFWHGLQATPRRVSGALVLPLRAPHQCAERPQPVSHVLNVAPARESSLAEQLSQLSRALAGCCKVAGFSFEPHALSLFWPRCRLSFLRCWGGVGLFCSADPFFCWRHCTWSWVTVLGGQRSCLSLAQARVTLQRQCADQSRSLCSRTCFLRCSS